MASTNADSEILRPGRQPWRKSTHRLSRRLFCCSCLSGEKKDPLQGQGQDKTNTGPWHPRSDLRGSGQGEAIQITVEDLGIDNPNFSLPDEDSQTLRNCIARSASSVSACPRALKKKRLKLLSSLPIQPSAGRTIAPYNGDDEEGEEEDQLWFESGTDSTPASESLLPPPVINLIPPTPSDVIDDDQFFDINSEESVAHTSGSDGSFAATDQESYEEKVESVASEESKDECKMVENKVGTDSASEPEEGVHDEFGEVREAIPTNEGDKDKMKPRFLRCSYQVAPLPENLQKLSALDNATQTNLLTCALKKDALKSRDVSNPDMLRAELCLLPHRDKMDACTQQRRRITRSSSFGDMVTRSAIFHALTQATDQNQEEESPRQRRITVASFMPQCADQNGNFPEKDTDRQVAKCLRELSTDEVCQWFTSIGLQKCLPFIRGANLCGADVASIDVNTLDVLHIATLEEREQLLSAIYNELHPPSTHTQRLDSLLETAGPNNDETFTAALVSMSKSKSSPHVSSLSMSRRSLTFRYNSPNYVAQRNSQLIEVTINVSEQIVHLRTPKDTTVGKIVDSCIKMLGMTEDKNLFTLKHKRDSAEELSLDQQLGSLLTSSSSSSENRQLELHLCKMEKPKSSQSSPELSCCYENGGVNKNGQGNQTAKEDRIRELNQQVDSLQNVILQVQELHHGLVAFCSELKNADGEAVVEGLGSAELRLRLESVEGQLRDKRQNLQTLTDNINDAAAHKKKRLEVRLLDKMKLNCQVFQEEISMVHLTRQAAHLQNALQESYDKEKIQKKGLAISSLSQLVSPQSPAMLLVVQESQGPDGRYGFVCRHTEGSGLVVVQVDDSHLRLDDRLVEVNSVPVVNSTEEELRELLLQGSSAHIVVLRQPSPTLTYQQHPVLLQHTANPDPMQPISPQRDAVTMGTPPQRKVITI